jgi:serine protease Do
MPKGLAFLCVLPLVLSTSAFGQVTKEATPSFSCNGRLSPAEAAICSDDSLASLDRQLAALYGSKLRSLPASQQAELESMQTTWLAERNSCGTNKSCIRNAYEVRISSLRSPLDPSTPGGRTATSHQSPYVVDGLPLYGRVRFDSEACKEYHCTLSEKFPAFTWCHKEKTEKTQRGEVTSSNSILHSQDGTTVYVNRYIEPAFFGANDIRSEIERLSAKFSERGREIWMPTREGQPRAVIVVWGKIELVQLTPTDAAVVASVGSHKGLLVSFLGDLQRSAKAGAPIYQLAGGAGFIWAAAFNQDGRGVLRFLTIDASQIEHPIAAGNLPTSPPDALPSLPKPPVRAQDEEAEYTRIGWWSVTRRQDSTLSVCSASARFTDQTVIEIALIQSSKVKGWALSLSNPQWNGWVTKRSQHWLWLVTTRPWHGSFNVANDGKTLVIGDASIDFMNSLADTNRLWIFNDNKQPLLSLDMKDSDPAIKAVVNCVRQHPFNRAPAPEAGITFSGTGFFIAPSLLLTNNHVVKECKGTIQARYPDRASYPATIFGQDAANDLAILHTDMPSSSISSFHLQPRLGESVATYGFPYAGVLSSSGNFTLGNVTSLSGVIDDTRFLQISAPIQPGNSGGPLLDMHGRVVGVVVAQLNALTRMQVDNSVPQNVNFAIKAPIATNFLFTKGVTPKLDDLDASQPLPPSDVADKAKEFTVQVYCEGVTRKTSEGQ